MKPEDEFLSRWRQFVASNSGAATRDRATRDLTWAWQLQIGPNVPTPNFISLELQHVSRIRSLCFTRVNPFYLLSVVSMLAGCYAMSRGLSETPGQWKPLVSLMGVLQIYELVLLGLAVLLSRRVRLERDARMAFLLGLLFLVDATYLNTELAAAHPWTALWVALAHLAFLVPKLFVIRDVLGLTSLRTLTLTVAQISILVYIPSTFSAVHFMDSHVHATGSRTGKTSARHLRDLVGCRSFGSALPLGRPEIRARRAARRSPGEPCLALLALPPRYSCTSSSLHWMYNLRLSGAYLAPVLLSVGAKPRLHLCSRRLAPPSRFAMGRAAVSALSVLGLARISSFSALRRRRDVADPDGALWDRAPSFGCIARCRGEFASPWAQRFRSRSRSRAIPSPRCASRGCASSREVSSNSASRRY